MAFNPFSAFREHKKGALVALTILTMIIFIGQFGAGDPIGRVMGLFGGGRASGEVVTTLYGKKVRESDVGRLGRNRKLASDFLGNTTMTGHVEVSKELAKRFEGPGEGNPLFGAKRIFTFYKTELQGLEDLFQKNPSMRFQAQFFVTSYLNRADENLRDLEAYSYSERDRLKDDDRAALNKLVVLLGYQRSMVTRAPGSFYFGGTAKTEEVLDFRLWQVQADRLGIKLTDDDVIKEIIAEAAGADLFDSKLSFAEQTRVQNFLRPLRRDKAATSSIDLLDALREEFRVVLAQSILLGSEPGARAYRSSLGVASTPALATPDEFLHYYREQRTALRVQFFPISATSFLDKVKGTPSEADLALRFERGAKQEANPAQREPGFKQPRRVAIEYVVASPEDAFYKEQGRKDAALLAKLSDPRWRVGDFAISLTAPGLAKVIPLALDPLYSDFAKALRDNPDQAFRGKDPELGADFAWSNFQFNPISDEIMRGRLHYTSVIQPASIVATTAGLQGGPLTGLTSLIATATRAELRQSIPINLSMMLAQANPQQLLGAAGLAMGTLPPPMPQSLLEPQIVAAREKSLAAAAMGNAFTTLSTELTKLSKKPTAARAAIDKAVKDNHLHVYAMPHVETLEGLIVDLKAKKSLNLDLLRKAMRTDEEKKENLRMFASQLFGRAGEYIPEFAGVIPGTKQEVLFWRSQDKKAEERPFEKVREEVVSAWRLEKARAMARDEAERLEAEVNKMKARPAAVVSFLKEQHLGKSFELDNVSQLVRPAKEVLANRNPDYTPYQIPEDKSEDLPYPPPDLAKQLMKLTRRGDTTVIVDLPAKTYYLALLLEREVPDLPDFKKAYALATRSDQMYRRFQGQRTFDYRKSVLEQLRREASGELDKDGRFKLAENFRKQDMNSAEGE